MQSQEQNAYFVQPTRIWKTSFTVIFSLAALFLGYCAWMARGPNETVNFERDAVSQRPFAVLSQNLSSVTEWKKWFFTVADVQVVDSQDHALPAAQQVAQTGEMLKIIVDPKKDERHKFEIAGRIARFVPGQVLEIQLLDDSTGKIFRLFDRLEWKIELIPPSTKGETLIRGTEVGHTAHWRSRLFARIAQRIMMSQLFYPDLIELANPAAVLKVSDEK